MHNAFGISESKLIMPGFIDNIFEYYKAMNIFLLPSRSEGFSLALLEAAASGLPIIASNIPGNDEFIHHKKNGLLFNISNPEELKNCITDLVENQSVAKEYGEFARKDFEKEFTLRRYSEKLENFLIEAYSKFHQTNSD